MTDREHELNNLANRVHKNAIIIDVHSDLMYDVEKRREVGQRSVLKHIHLPRIREGGVTAQILALSWDDLGSETYLLKRTLRNIGYFYSEVSESDADILFATNATDIKNAKKEGKVAFVLGLEGCKLLGNDVNLLKIFHELGVRCVGLTHQFRNYVSDGCGERTNCGLSLFGLEVIKELNNLGILIDVSHISEAGFWDVLEVSKDPIIASHSNAKSVCDNPRNLSDEQIIALASKGGLIGMNTYPAFVCSKGKPTIEKFLDHIDHTVSLVGVNHVCLGLDFIDFMIKNWEREKSRLGKKTFGEKYAYTEGIEDVTKVYDITRRLLIRGYSKGHVEKILGLNFLKLFEKVCGK